jgi:hypothetical protein
VEAEMAVTNQTSTLAPETQVNQFAGWIQKFGIALVVLICGLVVFVLGTSYYDRFVTNTTGIFKIGTSVVLLASALYFLKSDQLRPYWRLVYAFFVASTVNVVTWTRRSMFAMRCSNSLTYQHPRSQV